jgi:glycosyltransferase involved in cell wall biosynthesis
MILRIFALALALLSGSIFSISQDYSTLTSNTYKTSVIIPCCAKHAQHLYSLLELLEKQTILPDEVVISLSESTSVDSAVMSQLQNSSWPFPVKLLLSEQKMYAGENRNKACEYSTGEVLITQDADDIPHPQRIEIIKYFFKNHKIDHLMHMWVEAKPHSSILFRKHENLKHIPFFYPTTYEDVRGKHMTNGNVAISRRVFEKIKWSDMPRGQDSDFNKRVYINFRKRLALRISLLAYRIYLSSIATKEEIPSHYAVDNQSFNVYHQNTSRYPVEVIICGATK